MRTTCQACEGPLSSGSEKEATVCRSCDAKIDRGVEWFRSRAEKRIALALGAARELGAHDGDHHKAYAIDQMVRHLTGCRYVPVTAVDVRGKQYSYERLGESDEYEAWVADTKSGEDGPETYCWDEGIPP